MPPFSSPLRSRLIRRLGALLFMLGGVIALSALLVRLASPTGFLWVRLASTSGFLVLSAWSAWAFAQAWVYPRRLARAERLWIADGPHREILAQISNTRAARGEIAYRLHLLASRVHLGEGDRTQAWQESFLAHRFRLPVWKRLPILVYSHLDSRLSARTAATWEARLFRFAPELPSLNHQPVLQRLATDSSGLEMPAWERLLAILPTLQDDPLLLEFIMLSALDLIQNARTDRVQLGHQEWSPLVPYLFEEALGLLLRRHGEPRVGWDRTPPALHLLRQGRLQEVIRLAQSLPLARRSASLCEAEVAALRQIGDLRAAQAAIHGALGQHPGSFQLWLERFHAAMAVSETGIARESLERAERLLPSQPQALRGPCRDEWHLRSAELAYWLENAPERAWTHLQALAEPRREEQGLLVLQVQLALGQYEQAFEKSRRLLARQPRNGELLMLHAECLAGMDAWESLLPFLEALTEEARQLPAFWHLKGLAQSHLGNPQAAREDLECAVRMAPRDLRAILDAGYASKELSDHARAEEHWRHALQLDRTCEEALTQLADTRRARQDPEGARRLLRECLLHHPGSEKAQAYLAELEAN